MNNDLLFTDSEIGILDECLEIWKCKKEFDLEMSTIKKDAMSELFGGLGLKNGLPEELIKKFEVEKKDKFYYKEVSLNLMKKLTKVNEFVKIKTEVDELTKP